MNTPSRDVRLPALRRFAIAITALNVLGHLFFGFEQSWAQLSVGLATAYSTELVLELVGARSAGRRPRFAGNWRTFVDFMLSAHITGLAVSMLLYSGGQLGPIAFAAAAATGSKAVIRVPTASGTRHLMNPSNAGITLTLLLFPWVGIAPPYHFTENLPPAGQWIVPAFILVSGSMLNIRMTRRWPLILAWVATFALQAVVRWAFFGASLTAALLPISGVAFILYTFYMVTDPATTPSATRDQIAFGMAVGIAYGILMMAHVVFGLFFALSLVCALRGVRLYARAALARVRTTVVQPRALEGAARVVLPQP